MSRSGGVVRHGAAEASEWQTERQRLQSDYLHKQGVDCEDVTLLVHVRPCEGLVRQADGTIEKRFAKSEVAYPVEVSWPAGGGTACRQWRRQHRDHCPPHSPDTCAHPCRRHRGRLQLVVRRNPAPDPRFQPETAAASLASYDFKAGARALFLGRAHYGCHATILPDASGGLTRQGQQLAAGGGGRAGPFRVLVEPGPTNLAAVAQSGAAGL